MEFIKENKYLLIIVYLIVLITMSLLTLLFYKVDKEKAKKSKWRTKESTLLILPWLFGSIGGVFGIFVLRHKTKHWYFVVNNTLALCFHILLFILLVIV